MTRRLTTLLVTGVGLTLGCWLAGQADFPIIALVYWIGGLLSLTLLARILAGPFSDRIIQEVRNHPVLHGMWGIAVAFYLVWLQLLPQTGVPDWWVRRGQRKTVFAQAEAAGGWNAIRAGCESLATNNPNESYWFPRGRQAPVLVRGVGPNAKTITPAIPSALAVLSPFIVELNPAWNDPGIVAMRLKFFGGRISRGPSIPYYGLELAFGTNALNFQPKQVNPSGVLRGRRTYRKIAEGVYEVY